jgi:pseudouridine-5'-phosphate glycosidase
MWGRLKKSAIDFSPSVETKKLLKIAERDVAFAISARSSGGTTVSATCLIANMVGIEVFATGGIGGVHRGSDWDISADIKSLASHPVVVVSAGIKSILGHP